MKNLIRSSTVAASATLGFALLVVPSAVGQGVQNYSQSYALTSSHSYVLHGTKNTDGSCTFPGAVPGGASRSGPAPLILEPGQAAMEVRQTSLDESSCTTTMEQGTPPASAIQVQGTSNGQQEKSGSTVATMASGQTSVSTVRAARSHNRPVVTAAANSYSAGYVTTFYEDPARIDVNKVNDGIGTTTTAPA